MAWLAFGMLTRELHDGEIVVGSGADAGWRVSTADLMPRHFTVLSRGKDVSVRPCSAENVVVVNGEQLVGAPRALRDGDVVSAGSGEFVFSDFAPRSAPLEPQEPPRAYLVDDVNGVAHPLSSRSTAIGRDASNTIIVRDATASRFHAEIRREAGGYALHSMGSAGTTVNGGPIGAPCLLKEGDTLEIAFARLRFTQQPPGSDVAIAQPHDVRNDDRSRKPTMDTERIAVQVDNEAHRDSRRLRLGIALLALVAVAFFVWRAVRGPA